MQLKASPLLSVRAFVQFDMPGLLLDRVLADSSKKFGLAIDTAHPILRNRLGHGACWSVKFGGTSTEKCERRSKSFADPNGNCS